MNQIRSTKGLATKENPKIIGISPACSPVHIGIIRVDQNEVNMARAKISHIISEPGLSNLRNHLPTLKEAPKNVNFFAVSLLIWAISNFISQKRDNPKLLPVRTTKEALSI
jgi:hypothetical protein